VTDSRSDWYYASMADRKERDPYGPDGSGRATVVNGRGFQRWQRFHKDKALVWITTMDGKMVGMTPWQAKVYDLAKALIFDPQTMREMARRLGCSTSTVSRALVKLASWGLIAYVSMRGRYASTVIVLRSIGDGRDRFRQAAKAKVREWSKAAERRLSRLWANVAPYIIEGERVSSTQSIRDTYYLTKDATLTAQRPWTVQELRESGII